MRKASRKRFEPIPVKTVLNTKVRVIHPESLTAIYSNYVEVAHSEYEFSLLSRPSRSSSQRQHQINCHGACLLHQKSWCAGGAWSGRKKVNFAVFCTPKWWKSLRVAWRARTSRLRVAGSIPAGRTNHYNSLNRLKNICADGLVRR